MPDGAARLARQNVKEISLELATDLRSEMIDKIETDTGAVQVIEGRHHTLGGLYLVVPPMGSCLMLRRSASRTRVRASLFAIAAALALMVFVNNIACFDNDTCTDLPHYQAQFDMQI